MPHVSPKRRGGGADGSESGWSEAKGKGGSEGKDGRSRTTEDAGDSICAAGGRGGAPPLARGLCIPDLAASRSAPAPASRRAHLMLQVPSSCGLSLVLQIDEWLTAAVANLLEPADHLTTSGCRSSGTHCEPLTALYTLSLALSSHLQVAFWCATRSNIAMAIQTMQPLLSSSV